MEENYIENIFNLHKENEWKKIINEYCDVDGINKLLWVFPSEENIDFIKKQMDDNQIQSIISVGCGCGLLEWILQKAIGIDVTGIEIDGVWWNCKYAPPTFIPLHLSHPSLDQDKSTQDVLKTNNAAVLFCYFNNGPGFAKYMEYYRGNILIIIGPGEDKHTHTNPTPFSPQISNEWRLIAAQEVRNTRDFIAIYKKFL